MEDSNPKEVLDDLKSATILSANIVSAKNGDEAARDRLAEPRTIPMEFPGNRQRAMGHALVIIEDLEELGIRARREYQDQVMEPNEYGDGIHRIDIVVGDE